MTTDTTLEHVVEDFARGIEAADARNPRAASTRTGKPFQPGIGPHTEASTVLLVMSELVALDPNRYSHYAVSVPYPSLPRQRCDLCLGSAPDWDWAIEVKMLRLMGDNGKLNDSMLMHILSPYASHRSALTDCEKLAGSGLGRRRAIVIYGYEYAGWPLEPAIDAFECLAERTVTLGSRLHSPFRGLVHPVHQAGRVFGWGLQQ
jgi:hypothetical protein